MPKPLTALQQARLTHRQLLALNAPRTHDTNHRCSMAQRHISKRLLQLLHILRLAATTTPPTPAHPLLSTHFTTAHLRSSLPTPYKTLTRLLQTLQADVRPTDQTPNPVRAMWRYVVPPPLLPSTTSNHTDYYVHLPANLNLENATPEQCLFTALSLLDITADLCLDYNPLHIATLHHTHQIINSIVLRLHPAWDYKVPKFKTKPIDPSSIHPDSPAGRIAFREVDPVAQRRAERQAWHARRASQ